MESRDQVMTLCGLSLYSNHSKLSDITSGKLSVKSQFITHNSNKALVPIVHLWLSQGQEKTATKSRPDKQSTSGKIVSLILCVWKPGYVKSGHFCGSSIYDKHKETFITAIDDTHISEKGILNNYASC